MLLVLMALSIQQPVTRADAVAAALTRGARVALGRADTTAALGAVRTARAFPNPTLAGSYTKDVPNYHALGELPLDLPWLRAPRIGAAEGGGGGGPPPSSVSRVSARPPRDPVRRPPPVPPGARPGDARPPLASHRGRRGQLVQDRAAAPRSRRCQRARRTPRCRELRPAGKRGRRRLAQGARDAVIAAAADGTERRGAEHRPGRFAAPDRRRERARPRPRLDR